jgi:integrase
MMRIGVAVLDGAPIHFGVLPPKRGETRQRPWLYPEEWTRFAACRAVPVPVRVACAVALYTGLRPGELRALLWSDVDLKARTISVSKAFDTQTKSVKAPKTAQGQRIIPIQGSLLPLLTRLKGNADGPVLGTLNLTEDHMEPTFRAYLADAHVDRPRLTADNAAEEPIDFRSLRDTHATWLALAGVADKIVQRRLGHASPSTTDRYVRRPRASTPSTSARRSPLCRSRTGPRIGPTKAKPPAFAGELSCAGRTRGVENGWRRTSWWLVA